MKTAYIFFFDGYVSVAPTIISLAESLSSLYDRVVIFAKDTIYGRYHFSNDKIILVYCNDYVKPQKSMRKVKHFLKGVLSYFLSMGFPAFKDLMICVDDNIFPFVSLLSKIFFSKLLYLSLELPVNKPNFLNILGFSSVNAVLVQDEYRLNALFKAYNRNLEKFNGKVYFLPNSSINNAEVINVEEPDLVSQFDNFPSDKCVCAQIGMINEQVFSLELAKVFNYLETSVLVFHDRQKIDFENSYIKDLIETNSSNLYLSGVIYDFNSLSLAYKPIDIGIALYRYIDVNFGLIGKASGKLSFYLKYKKPVIVNELEGYSDLIYKYKCGFVIRDISNPKEWENAIKNIMEHYDYYSKNAYECFLKEFDFKTKVMPLLDYLRG